jgi:hypothetical protein
MKCHYGLIVLALCTDVACKHDSSVEPLIEHFCGHLSSQLEQLDRAYQQRANVETATLSAEERAALDVRYQIASLETRRAQGLSMLADLQLCEGSRQVDAPAKAQLEQRISITVSRFADAQDFASAATALHELAGLAREVTDMPITR